MNFMELAPFLISTGALVMSIATFARAGKWRDSEEAKDLDKRIGAVEAKVGRHEVKLENIATKADIARVEADIRGLGKEISNVDAGVTRIETFLMEHSKP